MSRKSKKVAIYLVALLIRLAIAPFFIDKQDYFVFIATAQDIILYHRGLYYSGSLQNLFNYPPLAYLAILPGMFVYYMLIPKNIYLERLFLKLPFILGDLFLAFQIGKNIPKDNQEFINHSIPLNLDWIKNYELFILFNPLFIYTSAVKGQFDVIPTIFIFYSLKYMRSEEYLKSGISMALSILFKQYGIFIIPFQFLFLAFHKRKNLVKYNVGLFVAMVPVLGLGALLNLQGMINHSLLYHLNRPPSGYSITTITYYSTLYTLRYFGFTKAGQIISQDILVSDTLTFVSLFGFLIWKFYKSDQDYQSMVKYMYLAYLAFLLFNKVFYFQYLLVLITLRIELMGLRGENFSSTQIAWDMMLMLFSVMFRVAGMTPINTRELLGNNWLFNIWMTILVLFLAITLITFKLGLKPLKTKKLKLIFVAVLLLYGINFVIQQVLENYWLKTGALNNLMKS